jgi:transposase-like protein
MPSSDTQFKPGDKRIQHRGRPHKLDDPDTLKAVAEAFANGATREAMCAAFEVKDPGTITRWRKDPRVKAEVRKLLNDRILRISSKTDSVIEQRLQNANEMTVDDLIKIRKEFGGSSLVGEKIDEDSMLGEAMDALEANPDLLDEMRALLEKARRRSQAAPVAEDDLPEVPDDASALTETE